MACALVACALVAGALVPWSGDGTLGRTLSNAMHPIGFAVATLLCALALGALSTDAARARRTLLGVVAGALALGAALELVQPLVGRTASPADVLADGIGVACGALAVTGLQCLRAGRVRRAVVALAGAGAMLVAALLPWLPFLVASATRPELPIVEDFGGAFALERVATSPRSRAWIEPASVGESGIGESAVGGPDRGGAGRTLVVEFGRERWPSVRLVDPPPDWRGHRTLRLVLANPGAGPLPLRLRIHDALHDGRGADRYRQALTLAPGASVVDVPLEAIRSMGRADPRRRMALDRIADVMLFASPAEAGRRLALIELRLVD